MASKKEFLENWYKRVWTDQDTNAIDELFAPEKPSQGLDTHGFIEFEPFKMFHTAIIGLLEDIDISVDKVIENGPWVSAMVTIRATGKANQKPIEITGGSFARIEDGQIKEGYDNVDLLGLWMQLGLLPENSVELGLQGQKIA